ncbi:MULTISPECIES: 50S ribosomal protein L33 [Bacillaceae]|uniref:Large ribosomal subunit protein bL33 n=1 Tax=Domibacillus aminovorans TaxID=29332 RepID=A0A177LBL1_9BACI|nr:MULTISPECIES: 50S ribosomal protein L33 [Bacillaceae]OAH59310.1 50S ribosomal protein L33 [Domibacillus aminovorans]OAH63003.1 50S ribosomal protein L33 [Domibacillus aminovorans]
MAEKVPLECKDCGSRNYSTTVTNVAERLEIKKFCGVCKKHTVHKQTK